MKGSIVYIGLGSNLDKPIHQLQSAINKISQLPTTNFLKCSSFYQSIAMTLGDEQQLPIPDYINAVVQVATSLEPINLLDHLQSIENAQGRDRQTQLRWQSRPLDLDILFYEDLTLKSPRLTIPHGGIQTRDFVLVPLLEIAPQLCFPSGEKVAKYRESCNTYQLKKLDIPAITSLMNK